MKAAGMEVDDTKDSESDDVGSKLTAREADPTLLSTPPREPSAKDDDHSEESDGEDEDDAEEEPRLKYASLTKSIGSVYRNGDATSSFLAAGDKMVCHLSELQPFTTGFS